MRHARLSLRMPNIHSFANFSFFPHMPILCRLHVWTFLFFHAMSHLPAKKEIELSLLLLLKSISSATSKKKINFQQATPAPQVAVETLRLKIDPEQWKLLVEFASLMWFRKMYASGRTKNRLVSGSVLQRIMTVIQLCGESCGSAWISG